MSRFILLIVLLPFFLWAKSQRFVYDNGHELSSNMRHLIQKHGTRIYEKSGIHIIVATGKAETPIPFDSMATLGVHLSEREILILTSKDLQPLISTLTEKILIRESKRLVLQGDYDEAVEFLFLNFAELIANDRDIPLSELFIKEKTLPGGYWALLLVITVVGGGGGVYLLKRSTRSTTKVFAYSSQRFGGVFQSNQSNLNGSIDI